MSPIPSSNYCEAKERCPKCAALGKDTRGDNLGRYTDGHAWCFSCGYYEPSDKIRMIEQAAQASKTKMVFPDCPAGPSCASTDGNECKWCIECDKALNKDWSVNDPQRVIMPHGCSKTIDSVPLEWLSKYDITREEVVNNGVMWTGWQKELVFPIRTPDGELIAYSARNFGPGSNKWISRGPIHDICHIVNYTKFPDSAIILVEDIVSAIKVGRHGPCMCLFGSHLSLKQVRRLAQMSKKFVIWLDSDKFKEAHKISKRFELISRKCKTIYTDEDPKACSDDIIKECIKF